MMDWYLGHDVGEAFAPKDLVYFDRLPSPDSWSNWGICDWPNYFDDAGEMVSDLSDERPNQPDAELSYGSSNHRGSSEDSWPVFRAAHGCPAMQFNDQTGTDPMDNMFLSFFLHDEYDAPAPCQRAVMPAHSDSAERILDFQSMSCDADGVGSSMFFRTCPFSPSAGSDNGHCSVPNVSHENSLDQSHSQSVKALETMEMLLSDQEAGGEDSSIEESVLLGLEAVLNQLSSKTLLCLRDSLYRLAQHSQLSSSDEVSVEGQLKRQQENQKPTQSTEPWQISCSRIRMANADVLNLFPSVLSKFEHRR